MIQHGAVLLRGFDINDLFKFVAVVDAVLKDGDGTAQYIVDAQREKLAGQVCVWFFLCGEVNLDFE